MSTWNDRLLPHPLLAPWTDDYEEATFIAQVPHAVLNNGRDINLTVKYHLTSAVLRHLVTEGKAEYVGQVACNKTFYRNSFGSDQEDELYILDAGQFADELKLTPYVVATQPIEAFISEEHNPEIREFKQNGFPISTGSILAVGDSTNVLLEEGGSPYSVIDLVSNPQVEYGVFIVDLEDNRIKIHMSRECKQQAETMRKHGRLSLGLATLFPGVYLHAVTEALRNLGEHQEHHWAQTIGRALENHGINPTDDESLKFNALAHAQKLMENPLGKLLTAFSKEVED